MQREVKIGDFLKIFEIGMIIFMLLFMIFAFLPSKIQKVEKKPFVKGMVYSGTERNGKFDGKGKLKVENVGFFEGNFLDGRFNGVGRFVFDDGTVYEANFKGKQGIDSVTLKDENGDIWEKGEGVWIREASKDEN